MTDREAFEKLLEAANDAEHLFKYVLQKEKEWNDFIKSCTTYKNIYVSKRR